MKTYKGVINLHLHIKKLVTNQNTKFLEVILYHSVDMELCNRIRLQNLYKVGIQSPSELHAKTMIPLRTISRNLAKIRQGLGPERKPGSGHKVKKNSNRLIVKGLRQIANKNRKSSAKKIVGKAHKAGSPPVHPTTIRRYLKSIGWKKQFPLKRPYLTAEMNKKRVKRCLEHRNFDWSKVIFSDESSFQLYRITQKQWGKKRV